MRLRENLRPVYRVVSGVLALLMTFNAVRVFAQSAPKEIKGTQAIPPVHTAKKTDVEKPSDPQAKFELLSAEAQRDEIFAQLDAADREYEEQRSHQRERYFDYVSRVVSTPQPPAPAPTAGDPYAVPGSSGLIYMQNRFYLPQFGKFTSWDKAVPYKFDNPQSFNLYAYVYNNPTMNIDPDGQEVITSYQAKAINRANGFPDMRPEDERSYLRFERNMMVGAGLTFGGLGLARWAWAAWGARGAVTAAPLVPKAADLLQHANEVMPEARAAGQWMQTTEHMSESASAYQSFITGVSSRMSYLVNGVKFDGVSNSGLVDAKGPGYAAFVDKAGNFASWFKGAQGLVDQATRQIQAANGTSVTWYFAEQKAAEATQRLFQSRGIEGITIVVREMKK